MPLTQGQQANTGALFLTDVPKQVERHTVINNRGEELLLALKAGKLEENEVFEALVKLLYKSIKIYGVGEFGISGQKLDEIVQDVMVRLYRYLRKKGFSIQTPLWPLVKRVTRSVVIDRFRAENRRNEDQQPTENDHWEHLLNQSRTPAAINETKTMFLEVLAQLNPAHRQVLVMSYYDGYTKDEIGRQLNLTRVAVQKRIETAREALGDIWRKQEVKSDR